MPICQLFFNIEFLENTAGTYSIMARSVLGGTPAKGTIFMYCPELSLGEGLLRWYIWFHYCPVFLRTPTDGVVGFEGDKSARTFNEKSIEIVWWPIWDEEFESQIILLY
ncbi:hypothetical protein Tco_0815834 [Tanacetum coccineum]